MRSNGRPVAEKLFTNSIRVIVLSQCIWRYVSFSQFWFEKKTGLFYDIFLTYRDMPEPLFPVIWLLPAYGEVEFQSSVTSVVHRDGAAVKLYRVFDDG